MKFIKLNIIIGLLFVTLLSNAQSVNVKKVEWHSYTQLRFATNFNSYNNFSVRRLKFWIKSAPGFSKHWSYKVQAIFMSLQKEKFFLQDAYGQYNWKKSNIRFGQFIPRFSLQRFQPDYLIPSSERARAINFLISDGTHGVRDVGVQYNLNAAGGHLKFNIGAFNGYGIKQYRFNNSGYLLTQNLSYEFNIKLSKLKFGYSISYRQAQNMYFAGIISDTILYSGNDFRYNFYGIFTSKFIDAQAEYLHSKLDVGIADGYYTLLTIKPNQKNHIYFMYDQFKSDNILINNNPWYITGYNYLINNYKLMISLETAFQKTNNSYQNRTVLQLQMFLH
jgi:hypothetical protein